MVGHCVLQVLLMVRVSGGRTLEGKFSSDGVSICSGYHMMLCM